MPFAQKLVILLLVQSCCCGFLKAQQTDTTLLQQKEALTIRSTPVQMQDSVSNSMFSPRKAIIRSALIPGWGQIYNKKYWKLPLVYGALGTTGYLFFRNLKQYKEAKEAYILATDGDPSNDGQIKQPYFAVKDQPERIRNFRNEVRQNVDYSVLFFIIFWGLNVADAAVDAHLKSFDVSDNLSFQLRPGFSPLTQSPTLRLIIPIGAK